MKMPNAQDKELEHALNTFMLPAGEFQLYIDSFRIK